MLINMVPATPDQIAQYEQLPELVNQHDETIEDTGSRYVEVSNHQPPQYIEHKQVIQDQLEPAEGNSVSIPQNDNELVTYIQCVPHTTGQQIIQQQTNEAQVIVSNKVILQNLNGFVYSSIHNEIIPIPHLLHNDLRNNLKPVKTI